MSFINNKNFTSFQNISINIEADFSHLPEKDLNNLYSYLKKNFHWVATNVEIQDKYDLLKIKAFAFGELHTEKRGALLYGRATNQLGKIFKDRVIPLVESAEKVPLNYPQLKHVNKSISQKNVGWDTRDQALVEFGEKQLAIQYSLAGFFLRLKDEHLSNIEIEKNLKELSNEPIFEERDQVIHDDGYPTSTALLNYLKENIDLLQKEIASTNHTPEVAAAFEALGVLVHRAMVSRTDTLLNTINSQVRNREIGLTNKIHEISNSGNISAIIAGRDHVDPELCITHTKLDELKIPYIFLHPKKPRPKVLQDRTNHNFEHTKSSSRISHIRKKNKLYTNVKELKSFYDLSSKDKNKKIRSDMRYYYDQFKSIDMIQKEIDLYKIQSKSSSNSLLSSLYYHSSTLAKISITKLFLKGLHASYDIEAFKTFLDLYQQNRNEFKSLSSLYNLFDRQLLNFSKARGQDKKILKYQLLNTFRKICQKQLTLVNRDLRVKSNSRDLTILDKTSEFLALSRKQNRACSVEELTLLQKKSLIEDSPYLISNKEKLINLLSNLEYFYKLPNFSKEQDAHCNELLETYLNHKKDEFDLQLKFFQTNSSFSNLRINRRVYNLNSTRINRKLDFRLRKLNIYL